MLSSKSAEILSMIEDNRANDILDMETFAFLEEKGFIAYTGRRCAYVTPVGKEALEDYYHYIKALEREEKTLELSQKSIQKSHTANWLSAIALCVTGLLSLASLLVSIFYR